MAEVQLWKNDMGESWWGQIDENGENCEWAKFEIDKEFESWIVKLLNSSIKDVKKCLWSRYTVSSCRIIWEKMWEYFFLFSGEKLAANWPHCTFVLNPGIIGFR